MGYGYGGHMGGYGGTMMYGYGGLFIWLIVIALAGVAIYFLVMRSKSSPSSRNSSHETAIHILQKRFAKGEITKEEYENMKNHLKE